MGALCDKTTPVLGVVLVLQIYIILAYVLQHLSITRNMPNEHGSPA